MFKKIIFTTLITLTILQYHQCISQGEQNSLYFTNAKNILEWTSENANNINKITKLTLSTFSHMERLHFCINNSLAEFEQCFKSLEIFTNLNELIIDLPYSNLTNNEALIIAETLQNFTHLESLELNLSKNKIDDDGAIAIANVIIKLVKLKHLDLDLEDNDFTFKAISHIFYGLVKKLPNLNHDLKVLLIKHNIKSNNNIKFLISHTSSKSFDSSNLKITLDTKNIFDDSFYDTIKTILEDLSELSAFSYCLEHIWFENNIIDNREVSKIIKLFEKLTYIKEIELDLDSMNMGNTNAIKFIKAIQKLSNLDSLYLNLKNNNISNEFATEINKILRDNLTNLKNLKLILRNNHIGRNYALQIFQTLRNNSQLNCLLVDLENNSLLEDEIINIVRETQEIPNLNEAWFFYSDYDNAMDFNHTLNIKIEKKLENITHIKPLEINLSFISIPDRNNFTILKNLLEILNQATFINLSFCHTNIQNKEFLEIAKKLISLVKNNNQLKTIVLHLDENSVDKKIVDYMYVIMHLYNTQIEVYPFFHVPNIRFSGKIYEPFTKKSINSIILQIETMIKYLHLKNSKLRKEIIWEIIAVIWGSEKNDILDEEVVENIYQFLMSE
jgi:hypothetical protein